MTDVKEFNDKLGGFVNNRRFEQLESKVETFKNKLDAVGKNNCAKKKNKR